ncbi:MAG TPA: TlpA disulfide reductase family protein [Gemmatimonadales bacterium]
MTNRQQWVAIASAAMAAVFAVALLIKIRPQMDLLEVGSRAPDFHAVDLATGRATTLADYKGKVILLNIWATWCQPCRVEMPAIQRLHQKLGGKDFQIVSVSIDVDGDSVVTAFARELGLTFQILHNQSGDIQQIYQTTGVPESFVIDRDGIIVKKVIGAAEWDGPVNETLIERLTHGQ